MDKSDLEIILQTWNNTEIPPNPRAKAQNNIFKVIFLEWTEQIIAKPFVSSNNPISNPLKYEISILKKLAKGEKINIIKSIKWLLVNTEITTAKKTMKPPIIKMFFIEQTILFFKTSPIFDGENVFGIFTLDLYNDETLSFFDTNRNNIPTVIADKTCVINNKKPMEEFANKVIPTVPIINRGPELLVNASRLSASDLEHLFCILNSVTIFAPTGYPLIRPIMNA